METKMNAEATMSTRNFLLLSDFDQTLSFKDSGQVLAETMGIPDFHEHVRSLSDTHLVQQGGELAYLLLHDPAFKDVRKAHLREAGKKVRLKNNIQLLSQLLENIDGAHFPFTLFLRAHRRLWNRHLKASCRQDTSMRASLPLMMKAG